METRPPRGWMTWARRSLGEVLGGAWLLIALTGVTALGSNGAPEVDPRVRDVIREGEARVIVELRIPGGVTPEGRLGSPGAITAQRNAIAVAQDGVLTRLTGTRFLLAQRYRTVPFLALTIGPDALAALEGMSDLVTRVRTDTTVAPRRQSERSSSSLPPQGAGGSP